MTTDSQKRITQTTSTTFFNRLTGEPVTVTRTEYTGPLRRGPQFIEKPAAIVDRAINPTHM